MAIVSDLSKDGAPDVSYSQYREQPIYGVPGYTSITVNNVEGLRVGSGTNYTQVQARGTDANQQLVLSPMGTGGVAAHLADGATSGGNARGANSTDWQTVRASAAQVASGSRSTVSGGNNNTASGTNSTVAGGDSNVAQSTGTAIAGGRGNTAQGSDSWVPGGYQASTRGRIGSHAFANGQFSATGDAQASGMILRGRTTDATPLVLTADANVPGISNQFNVPNYSCAFVRISIVARTDSGSNGKALWDGNLLLRRDNGVASVALSGTPSGIASTGIGPNTSAGTVTGWLVTCSADTTNGALTITVTGAVGQNISWVARIDAVETVYQ